MHLKLRKADAFTALIALLLMLLAPPASAGAETGTIQPGWFAYSDGLVFLFLSGTHGSACSQAERWAIDPSTQAGKIHFAVFLTAYANGKTVNLSGDGTCAAHGNTEMVSVITVTD